MTRLLRIVTTTACALAVLAVPPAHAGASRYAGDCGFDTVSQDTVTGPDVFTGFVYASVVLYAPDHGNVVNATVTCELTVNGVVRSETSQWGSGAVAFVAPMTFAASETDDVDFCTVVDYTSDDTPTTRDCMEATTPQWPPQETYDWFSELIDWVNWAVVTHVDPTACQVLPLLAPGLAPHVTVNEQGDVFLGPDPFWDCPPYDHFPQPDPPPPLGAPPLPGFEPFVPTGGGYNTGEVGFLQLVAPDSTDVASACAYATDDTGAITVVGSTATAGALAAAVRCRLTDTQTGAVLYDQSVRADAPVARLTGTIAANTGPVTVCTGGTGEWADRSVTVGLHCRIGEPLDQS